MKEKITISELQDFLKDFEDNGETQILEEGKEKEEVITIAKARGINLKKNRDLAGFKNIYAFANKANKNKVRLPKEKLLKALPTLVGKPIDIDHNRGHVVGHYIDYRYKEKEDAVVTYGVFYKSHFGKEWDEAKKLFKKKKLATSYEIWCAEDKRKRLPDGTEELHDMEIAGGAILLKDEPAFEGAKVLEIAKKNIEDCKELVFASKYEDKDLITSDYYKDEVKKNIENLQKEKEALKEEPKVETKEEPKIEDKPKGEETKDEKSEEPKKETPKEEIKEENAEEPKEKKEENKETPKPDNTIPKIKCSNCQEEIDLAMGQTEIKCPKCFAILDASGKMKYPPQIKDFKMICPSCGMNNWLILENLETSTNLKCLNCAKEYGVNFKSEKVEEKNDQDIMKEKLHFLYTTSARCYQCGNRIPITSTSKADSFELRCDKCGLEFTYDKAKVERNRHITKIKEIEKNKNKDEPKKSSVEGGDEEMEFKLETSKFHRYFEGDFDTFEKELESDYEIDFGYFDGGLAIAKRMTYQEKKNLPDSSFAVVIRVKNKKTGEMRKIRMYPINDEAHVRNALARLGQPKPQATLRKLGVSVEAVKRKVLKRAKQLGMTALLERHKEKASIECSCTECGHKVTSEEHCVNLKCPKCGGQMRRTDRPGNGKPQEKNQAKEEIKQETSTKHREVIRKAVKKIIDLKKEKKLSKASYDETENKLKEGIKKVASQLIEAKTEIKKINEEADEKIKFYKDNAKEILSRQEELGEDFAKDLSDEEILDDDKFVKAKLEKENTLLRAKVEGSSETVGDKKASRDDGWYTNTRKQVDDLAFGKKN